MSRNEYQEGEEIVKLENSEEGEPITQEEEYDEEETQDTEEKKEKESLVIVYNYIKIEFRNGAEITTKEDLYSGIEYIKIVRDDNTSVDVFAINENHPFFLLLKCQSWEKWEYIPKESDMHTTDTKYVVRPALDSIVNLVYQKMIQYNLLRE